MSSHPKSKADQQDTDGAEMPRERNNIRRFGLYRGRRGTWLLLGLVLLLAVTACGTAATSTGPSRETAPSDNAPPTSEGATATPAPPIRLEDVPMVDTSISSVPLKDIVFDTFDGGFVDLEQAIAEPSLILRLRDAIAPIYQPAYGDPDDIPWLRSSDLVMGYVSGSTASAYPIKVLNFHELVNDVIDDVPVLITFCPLCASGVVFSRELDGRTLIFGNTSALFQADLVMFDHQTGSYWFQVAGEAIVGELTGARLDLLPSVTMTWGEWKALYPETRLLAGTANDPTLFFSTAFQRDPFSGLQDQVNRDRFSFPVDEDRLDRRLQSGELVLTVEVGDAATAYPLDRIGDAAVNDQIGGQPVVVFSRVGNLAAAAFSPVVDGQTLTFDYRAADQSFVDRQTGSAWDASGRASSGPLAGTQLERLDTRRAFWFSIAIAFPEINLYLP